MSDSYNIQICSAIRDRVYRKVCPEIDPGVWDQVRDMIGAPIRDASGVPVRDQIYDRVLDWKYHVAIEGA